ncbi:MAG TPA: lysophospholipid acyltransferase family protein [Magnetospirillaceae bacterium]|jgi:1-acyl-sn-glycerol-3-phosphate acyltransferase
MIILRSATYHLLFSLWTLIAGVAFLPLMLAPRLVVQHAAGYWVHGTLALQRIVLGLRYEIRGREHLPEGPAVIAAKHQSAWETLIFHVLLPDTVFVLKKSLLWLPLIGWYLLKTRQIAIDRAAGMKALGMMAKAARVSLARGSQVVIFPEGHRQPPGATGTYLPGVAMLYGEGGGNVPVIPVALNSGLFWPRNAFRRRPGLIVMQILPPMAAGLDRRAFMTELRTRIEASTRALEAEALTRYPDLVVSSPIAGEVTGQGGH